MSAESRSPTRPSHSLGSLWIGWWGEGEMLGADRRKETIEGGLNEGRGLDEWVAE